MIDSGIGQSSMFQAQLSCTSKQTTMLGVPGLSHIVVNKLLVIHPHMVILLGELSGIIVAVVFLSSASSIAFNSFKFLHALNCSSFTPNKLSSKARHSCQDAGAYATAMCSMPCLWPGIRMQRYLEVMGLCSCSTDINKVDDAIHVCALLYTYRA